MPLVGLDVDDEYKGVVLLDLLHGALGVERVDEDLGGIVSRLVVNRLAWVPGSAGELEGLGTVEGGGRDDLLALVRVDL